VTARAADWWNPITEDLVDLTSLAGGDRYQFAIANRRLGLSLQKVLGRAGLSHLDDMP
jgi:hypothetical protein